MICLDVLMICLDDLGGTCCTHVVHMLYTCCTRVVHVTSSTTKRQDHLSFFFDIGIQGRVGANVVVSPPFSDRPFLPNQATHRRTSCTCWLYSLCNFQYRQQYEKTCLYNFENVEFIRTCIFIFLFYV